MWMGGEMSEKHKTARSYRANILDDNAVVSINLKWLGQIIVLIAGLVYSYWRVETRIIDLEKNFSKSDIQIQELVNKHIIDEQARYAEMEEDLKWYQKALGKKKK
jgi:uncharacterized coiled-coil protein SlyX